MSLFRYIKLGILGLGGVSSVAALSSSRVRQFIGLSFLTYEEDRQWQFLYKLSQKLFSSLEKDVGSDLSENPKDSVIEWLNSKFNGSLDNEEDKWENFKSLCEKQKIQEIKPGSDVYNDYSRLCFLDYGEESKGYLAKWFESSTKTNISSGENSEFLLLSSKNIELWTSFNNKYPNASPLDKFDEWYFSDTFEAKNLKQVMDEISDNSPN